MGKQINYHFSEFLERKRKRIIIKKIKAHHQESKLVSPLQPNRILSVNKEKEIISIRTLQTFRKTFKIKPTIRVIENAGDMWILRYRGTQFTISQLSFLQCIVVLE